MPNRAIFTGQSWLSIKTITGPDPAKFTESTEGSGPGLRNLSENDDLSVPECSSGSGSNRQIAIIVSHVFLICFITLT